jgi:hypothetical protein
MATRRYEGPSGTQIQTTAGDVLKAAEATLHRIQDAYEIDDKRWESEREETLRKHEERRRGEEVRYLNALSDWLALPWWKRPFMDKPQKALIYPPYFDMFEVSKPRLHHYRSYGPAQSLVKAMSPLPPETLVMIDANDAALIGLGATTEAKEAK